MALLYFIRNVIYYILITLLNFMIYYGVFKIDLLFYNLFVSKNNFLIKFLILFGCAFCILMFMIISGVGYTIIMKLPKNKTMVISVTKFLFALVTIICLAYYVSISAHFLRIICAGSILLSWYCINKSLSAIGMKSAVR